LLNISIVKGSQKSVKWGGVNFELPTGQRAPFHSGAISAKMQAMEIVKWEEFVNGGTATPSALTIGVFDGVHRGHRALIEKVKAASTTKVRKMRSLVVTFSCHPRRTLHPERPHTNIITSEEQIAIFASLGIDILVLIDFSTEFSRMGGEEFIKTLVRGACAKYIAIGEDFKCGHGGETDAEEIKSICAALDIECEIVPPVLECGEPISSSRIRRALAAGDTKTAELLLGRCLKGTSKNFSF
jgi:riboflavin kinase/FMN adenylyltransferase